MLSETFANCMEKENQYWQGQKSQLDVNKIDEIYCKADEFGIKKMDYEHPGQAAWKRHGEDFRNQKN